MSQGIVQSLSAKKKKRRINLHYPCRTNDLREKKEGLVLELRRRKRLGHLLEIRAGRTGQREKKGSNLPETCTGPSEGETNVRLKL